MQDSTQRSGRDTECPSHNSSRRNARFSSRLSQSAERYMPRAVHSNCAGSSGRNRLRRSPPRCPLGDEAQSSIRIPPSGPRQAQIYRYRKYRQQSAGSYQTTNHVRNREIADMLGAMGSMACRETTVCRNTWGEQWSSNRVHRAEHVGKCQAKGVRYRLPLKRGLHKGKKEKGDVGKAGKTDSAKNQIRQMGDGTAAPSPTKGKEAGPRQCNSQLRPRQNKEALQVKTCLRPWIQEDAR